METVQFERIAERMKAHDDAANAKKIQDLIDKIHNGQMIVAFCGHFSAGKSTMINTLVGAEVLPSSPIPTSANLVLIRNGDSGAVAYKVDGTKERFDLTEEGLRSLKTLCADGDTVSKVEISVPSTFLPPHVALMDTPGIDSTDDAHRLVTESTLHLADAVYYVVDYNHVQSELNFQFTKTLIDSGKSVWLIVNQIDKHFDLEMDFDSYRESTEDAFQMWGIQLSGIYYTSLMEPDHPENQFDQLQQALRNQFGMASEILNNSVSQSARSVIKDHIGQVEQQNRENLDHWQDLVDRYKEESEDQSADPASDLRLIEQKLEEDQQLPSRLEEDVRKKVDTLLGNAPLTPYQTIQFIEQFLESRQSKFRVGFFGSQAKTEHERTVRLQALLEDIQERSQSAIEWHSKQLLLDVLKDRNIHSDSIVNSIQEIHVEIQPQDLVDLVNPGAALEGAYVHTFAQQLRSFIQSAYKKQVIERLELILTIVRELANARIKSLIEKKNQQVVVLQAQEALAKNARDLQGYEKELIAMLDV